MKAREGYRSLGPWLMRKIYFSHVKVMKHEFNTDVIFKLNNGKVEKNF
jgi:hypothetical protein